MYRAEIKFFYCPTCGKITNIKLVQCLARYNGYECSTADSDSFKRNAYVDENYTPVSKDGEYMLDCYLPSNKE